MFQLIRADAFDNILCAVILHCQSLLIRLDIRTKTKEGIKLLAGLLDLPRPGNKKPGQPDQ